MGKDSRRMLAEDLGLGLAAALSWLPALYMTADRLETPWGGLALGAAATGGLAALAGRRARALTDAPRAEGAWAGASVGGVAWLLGAGPVAAVISQLPVLSPTAPSDDPRAVLVTSLALAVGEAALIGAWAPVALLTGAALLGALAAGRGDARSVPAPERLTGDLAVLGLLYTAAMQLAFLYALLPMERAASAAAERGELITPLPPNWVELGATGLALPVVACSALAVASLRHRGPSRWLPASSLPVALAAGVFLATLEPLWRTWALPALVGAALGTLLPLRPTAAPPRPRLALRVVSMAALGATASQMGVGNGLGAVARIADLEALGAAAGPAPELVGSIAAGVAGVGLAHIALVCLGLLLLSPVVGWFAGIGRAARISHELDSLFETNRARKPGEEVRMTNDRGASRRVMVVLLAGVMALSSVASALAYRKGRRDGHDRVRAALVRDGEVVEVVVVRRDVAAGEVLTLEDLGLRSMSPDVVPAEVVPTRIEDVVGQRTVSSILAYELVRVERLATPDEVSP